MLLMVYHIVKAIPPKIVQGSARCMSAQCGCEMPCLTQSQLKERRSLGMLAICFMVPACCFICLYGHAPALPEHTDGQRTHHGADSHCWRM